MKRLSTLLLIACLGAARIVQAAPGDVDSTFNPGSGLDGEVDCVTAQPDGKVIIGGDFSSVRGAARNRIARLNPDGTVDSTFNPGKGADDLVSCLALQSDGKVLVGGYFTSINGTNRNSIARLNADGSLDTTFDPGTGADFAVFSVAVQTDGKIVVGGFFTVINATTRYGIARLNANGSVDLTFDPGDGADYEVASVAMQKDGKVILGGYFSTINGTNRNCIARLHANGSLDLTFNPGTGAEGVDPIVYAVAVQTNGQVVVAGDFSSINGTNRGSIARLGTNGGLDLSFSTGSGANIGADDYVYSVALQTDGKVVVGGLFTTIAGTSRSSIARLTTAGALDSTFNPGAGAAGGVYAVAAQTNGQVLIGGDFNSVNGTNRTRVARLNTTGGLDTTFVPQTGPNALIASIAAQPDGKVIVGGQFYIIGTTNRYFIARLNADGSLDGGFNPGGGADDFVECVALQTNGQVLVGGDFTTMNGVTRNGIARLNTNGTLDATFSTGTGADDFVQCLAVQTDNKALVGGAFTTINGTNRNSIARLNTNGALDLTFNIGTGADDYIQAIAVQKDGKVLVGGAFTSFNGTNRNHIARLNTNGTLDLTFNPGSGAGGYVNAFAVQSDGKVVIGGDFTNFNGMARTCIARLNTNGSLDATFDAGKISSTDEFTIANVNSIALQADGKVLMGGSFTTVNGTSRNRIARLNADGSLSTTFNPGTGATREVYSVLMQADGKVLVAGEFGAINDIPRAFVARLLGGSLSVSPIPVNIQKTGNQVVMNWTNSAFALQSAPLVGGTYTNVFAGNSPYTNSTSASQQFFRLKAD